MSIIGLSPELSRFWETAERNNGFALRELPKDTFFDIYTRADHRMGVVVVDPERTLIAIECADGPDLCRFLGSTGSETSSVIKTGWVGVGSHFRFRTMDGGLVTTPTLKCFVINHDPERAAAIRDTAKKRRPDAGKPFTREDLARWQADFDAQMAAEFSVSDLVEVQKWLRQFCPHGKCIAATFFVSAKNAGRLRHALALMPRHFEEHWFFKHPEICGAIMTPSDNHQWHRAYKEAGVPIPQD